MTQRTVVVTGSASGMGAATRARLEADGQRVIGVDLRDAGLCVHCNKCLPTIYSGTRCVLVT